MATGPFTRTVTTYWSGSSGARKSHDTYLWYRNGPGRKTPHPFTMARCRATYVGTDAANATAGYWALNTGTPTPWAGNRTDVHNRAYDKFKNQVQGVTSQLGATAAEWRQSDRMIVQRAGQLTRAMKALRRGRPFEFFKELGMLHRAPRRLPNRSDPKKAADLWLEWHFGWVPLATDLYDACQVLQKPTPQLIVARARASSGRLVWDRSSIAYPYNTTNLLYGYLREEIGGRVVVSNPNLFLANSLGVMNPAAVLWEIVPFSFVVDWIIPIGQFLESWTDFMGLTLTEVYTTKSSEYTSRYKYIYIPTGVTYSRQECDGWRVDRATSITGPSIALRPWKAPSVTRAATAISLLLQQFALAGKRL